MKTLAFCLSLLALLLGVFLFSPKNTTAKMQLMDSFGKYHFKTIEATYSPEELMEKERPALIKNRHYQYLEPLLQFSPYLLLHVKYINQRGRSEEGIILWDLLDGEMVTNASAWTKTKGFFDCLQGNLDVEDYVLIKHLAKNKNLESSHPLVKEYTENISYLLKKQLITERNGRYKLHVNDCLLHIPPKTTLESPLVTKNYKHAKKHHYRFTPTQIKKLASSYFGKDFAITSSEEIFLPIYLFTVENPDGSYHYSHWNALSGKSISSLQR